MATKRITDKAADQRAADKAWATEKAVWKFSSVSEECRTAIAFYAGWNANKRAIRAERSARRG